MSARVHVLETLPIFSCGISDILRGFKINQAVENSLPSLYSQDIDSFDRRLYQSVTSLTGEIL